MGVRSFKRFLCGGCSQSGTDWIPMLSNVSDCTERAETHVVLTLICRLQVVFSGCILGGNWEGRILQGYFVQKDAKARGEGRGSAPPVCPTGRNLG